MPDSPATIPSIARLSDRPEVELVLSLTRPRIGPEIAARIAELLGEGVNWEYVRDFAWRHRLLPLLHNRLSKLYPNALPDDLRKEFQHNAQGISQHNLLLTGELVALNRALSARGIPSLPFKGPMLAYTLYGNLAVRPFSDLDVLVRRDDVLRVGEILEAQGFRPKLSLTPAQRSAFVRYENDLTYIQEGTGIMLELHWRFFSRYVAFSLIGDFWSRLRTIRLAGSPMLAMPPEEHLLVLSVHGAKHLWVLLGWVLDVAQLLEVHGDIDWDYLARLARETGSERMLHLALILASDLFGSEIPDDRRRLMAADAPAIALANRVGGSIMADAESVGGIAEHMFYLSARERFRDRLSYGWLWLFTPNYKDQSFIPLPDILSPLHYLIRPIRMAADLAARVIRRGV
jgi:hypothetical protein